MTDDTQPIWKRILESARGDRPMKGYERVLFYLLVAYCGGEFLANTILPGARALTGG